MRNLELLAPAGNLSKLKTALMYGADAVYIGGSKYGLRANAGNFTYEQMEEALEYAHSLGKKVYVTVNVVATCDDIEGIRSYAPELERLGVDGVIVSDLGVFATIKEVAPGLKIHVSTQSSTTNHQACKVWQQMGAVQINIARETPLKDISVISSKLPSPAPVLEAFVHGAMCMSYSGRCMLSDYMTGRSSNGGDCAQPCRWKYFISEETRPGEYMPVYEDERGTFLFNSKDLCMLEYLPQMVEAGVGSFKIEGRMKSEFYTAVTVRAYRIALDHIMSGRKYTKELVDSLLDEVCSVSHRQYSTGFYLGKRGEQVYNDSSYIRTSDFVGVVEECEKKENGCRLTLSQRGLFTKGQELEFVMPVLGNEVSDIKKITVWEMYNDKGEMIERAPHAKMKVIFDIPFYAVKGTIVRCRKREEV